MKQPKIYHADWSTKGWNDLVGQKALENDFDVKLIDEDILFAAYTQESYEGHAFVLFRKEGKLYEVNGSHCSCYGLEHQWEPEETTIDALEMRLEKGAVTDYDGRYDKELTKTIKWLRENI